MAERTAGKAKKQGKKPPVRSAGAAAGTRPRAADAANLAAECARLRAELRAAEARIDVLEGQRKEILDRINWAIDSLSTLRET
jgi:hypothetical protein